MNNIAAWVGLAITVVTIVGTLLVNGVRATEGLENISRMQGMVIEAIKELQEDQRDRFVVIENIQTRLQFLEQEVRAVAAQK